MSKKIIFTEEQINEITNLYNKELLSSKEVGKRFNCDDGVILKLLNNEGIDTSRNNRRKLLFDNGKLPIWTEESKKKIRNINLLNLNEKEIINLYPRFSIIEIANRFGCSFDPIKRILKENNIPLRKEKITEYGKIKLRNLYLNKNLEEIYGEDKAHQIKENMSKSSKGIPKTVEHNLKNSIANTGKIFSIEHRKKLSATRQGIPLENWKKFVKFDPYTINFNERFKEFVRQRENLSCLKCNLFQADSLKLYNRKLAIHHIDYIKENTIPENCCALCTRCNAEVNFNRKSWTKFFNSLKLFLKFIFLHIPLLYLMV
jgi:hypothetical protein